MNAGINKTSDIYLNSGKSNDILWALRASLLAMLLFIPIEQGKGEDVLTAQQEETTEIYQQENSVTEAPESMVEYEAIFKEGVRKALEGLDSMSQIPVGGKKISYYRDAGVLKGKKMTLESMNALNLPTTFDISPRKVKVKEPISHIVVQLDNRRFQITPDIGKIRNIYLNKKEFVIVTDVLYSGKYDKKNRLPDLMYRLWMTPVGKGEKKGFKLTTVTEI